MSTDHIDQVWSKSEDPLECDMNHWLPEYLLSSLYPPHLHILLINVIAITETGYIARIIEI